MDSPLGSLLLVASPAGLVRVAYSVEDHEDVLEGLEALAPGGVERAGAALDGPARQFEDYFAGRRNEFTVRVDLPDPPPTFGAQVLQTVQRVPYGAVATYTDIAALAGRPDSVRAVGAACARNPLPIVVPCHRVVRLDGSLGHYVAGPAAKRWLLRFETLGPDRQVPTHRPGR
ncbi:methylated-DNA--[protein]-cysteine S-methyltransferase [Zafaria cholistanensis]|uniref:methylated-DNA--[protein]-cysteine S-methyltransferase n=1 Tax=Zafaria cholistanensis TaxID=1682741 RepID=UPI00155B296B|nr:methylated-DNA--[protein]-cysteine S-methyltransferase [Zafaria cholistanensis]